MGKCSLLKKKKNKKKGTKVKRKDSYLGLPWEGMESLKGTQRKICVFKRALGLQNLSSSKAMKKCIFIWFRGKLQQGLLK